MRLSEKKLFDKILNAIYPVGSIYISTVATSPADLIGGTWERITGRFLLAATDNGASSWSTSTKSGSIKAGVTGGEAAHTLSISEIPSHAGHVDPVGTGYGTAGGKYLGTNNVSVYGSAGRGWDAINGNEIVPHRENRGGGGSHSIMPPFLAVYMWKRTA